MTSGHRSSPRRARESKAAATTRTFSASRSLASAMHSGDASSGTRTSSRALQGLGRQREGRARNRPAPGLHARRRDRAGSTRAGYLRAAFPAHLSDGEGLPRARPRQRLLRAGGRDELQRDPDPPSLAAGAGLFKRQLRNVFLDYPLRPSI
eukprot:660047-Pyramimonas_sp.AAC.1